MTGKWIRMLTAATVLVAVLAPMAAGQENGNKEDEGLKAFCQYNPASRLLKIGVGPNPLAHKMEWTIHPTGESEPKFTGVVDTMMSVNIPGLKGGFLAGVVEMPPTIDGERAEMPAGTYVAEMTLLYANGEKSDPLTAEFVKLDEEKELPWWNTEHGNPEQLLPQFTELTYDSDKNVAGAWNREYHLDGLGMPRYLVSNGMDLTVSPIRMVLTVDGREMVVDAEGKPTLAEQKPWKEVFTGETVVGGVKFSTRNRLEQDGAMFIELTWAPAGDEPVKVDALRIDIPMRGDMESLFADTMYIEEQAGSLPAGSGVVWSSKKFETRRRGMAVGFFVPQIWMGDDRNGLLFFGDNTRGWVVRDDSSCQEIIRTGDSTMLRLNICTGAYGTGAAEPYVLDSPQTLVFALNPTPSAKYRPDWRCGGIVRDENGKVLGMTLGGSGAFNICDGPFDKQHRCDQDAADEETAKRAWTWWHPESKDPNEWGKYFERMKNATSWEYRKIALPVAWYGWNTGVEKWREYMKYDWKPVNGTGVTSEYSDSQQDHFIWCLNEYISKGGLQYVYMDVCNIQLSSNLLNGRAYLLPDGKLQRGYGLFARREFAKRINCVFLENGQRPWVAANIVRFQPQTPFLSSYLTGDTVPRYQPDYTRSAPDAYIRAAAIPMIYGGVLRPWFELPGQLTADPLARGLPMLYNMFNGSGMTGQLTAWGFYDQGDKQKFYPFWRNADAVTVADGEDVKVSILKQGEKFLVIAVNYSWENPATPTITIDPAKLDLPAKVQRGLRPMQINNRPVSGKKDLQRTANWQHILKVARRDLERGKSSIRGWGDVRDLHQGAAKDPDGQEPIGKYLPSLSVEAGKVKIHGGGIYPRHCTVVSIEPAE